MAATLQPEIEFEKEIYLPGEEVTGRAWMSTTKNMKVKTVEITFSGKSVTTWGCGGKPVATKKTPKGEETYVEMKHEVWAPDNEENTFPSGDYEWKFSFELPKDCPPSFEGKFGFVRYSVLLHMEIPNGKPKNVERAVTVSPIIDLNLIPGARDPTKIHLDNTAYYCQCMPCLPARGNVVYTLTSPKLGYVAGETVTVSGQIENGTSKPLRLIEARLNRKITYREELSSKGKKRQTQNADRFKSKIENQVLETKIERCNVGPRTNTEYAFTFTIPPVVATIRNSRFISVEYFVSIFGDTGMCNRGDRASLNILVGNVPVSSGSVALVPQKFVDGNAAQAWKSYLKPNYTYQVPYYG
uniref:Arrestin_C domain-containing protein n=1 Tax=Caenorhabditis tropicalis TaxID=1561998 RepID=A0A1I7TDN8_9PELO